jgi:hypothetical protein
MNRTLSTVAALTAALALAGCGSAAETTSTKGETTSAVVSGEEATATGSSDGQAEDVAEAGAELKVSEYGFTQLPKSDFAGPSVSYAVLVTNEGGAIATNAQVQISFEDKAGGVVDSQEDYLTAVLPGTSVALGGVMIDAAGVEKMTVQVLPGDSEPLEGKQANFEVTKIKTKTQEYTGVKTTASVSSPFVKDVKDAMAVAVYRNAKGKIIGGDSTFINFIPAGGKAAVSIDSFSQMKVPAKTEVYVALSGLSLLE